MIIESMSCPVCSSENLTLGVIMGRSPGVKFKRARGLLGDLSGVLLTSGFFSHSAQAWRCEGCGTVVVPGRRR
jgi:transposase-like protein